MQPVSWDLVRRARTLPAPVWRVACAWVQHCPLVHYIACVVGQVWFLRVAMPSPPFSVCVPSFPLSSFAPPTCESLTPTGLPASPTASSRDDEDSQSCASASATTSDLSSLPTLLASLELVDPSLVSVKEQSSGILTDAEALSRATRPVARELLVS